MRFSSMPEIRSGIVGYPLRLWLTDPQRFASQDPIQEAGGLNLYSLVGNNPANDFDPLGLDGFIYQKNADGTSSVQVVRDTPAQAAAKSNAERGEIIQAGWDNGGREFAITAATLPVGGPEIKIAEKLAKPALKVCKNIVEEINAARKAKDSLSQLKEIEKAKRAIDQGKIKDKIIYRITGSKQAAKNLLNQVRDNPGMADDLD